MWKSAVSVLAFVLVTGCGGTNPASHEPLSPATAVCSATVQFSESVEISLEGIDYTHNDWSYIARIIDSSDSLQVGALYRRYKKPVGETGWSEPDAFAARAGAWIAGFEWFGNDSSTNIFQLSGEHTGNLGERWMYKLGGSMNLLSNGSGNTILSLETGLKYYLTDTLRLTGDWTWSRWDNGGSFSYSYYNFGAEMLIDRGQTFLVGAEYEHEHINNGGGNSDNLLLKTAWYGSKVMAGLNGKMCRGMFDELYFYGLEVGFLVGPNGMLKAGFEQIAGSSVSDNLNNASVSYEIRF